MTDGDTWDPDRYERFRAQRDAPAHDLLELVRPAPGARTADLGCGTGRFTAALHERVAARETIGIDTSAAMLDRARTQAGPGIDFVEADLAELDGTWDVLFANASLQWVPDHGALLPRLVERLAAGGQLAFQVPANFGHHSHVVADELGRTFGLEPLARTIDACSPAAYAEILHAAGLRDLDVTLRIYGHELARTDEVIEWVSGTLLTSFERRLSPPDWERFQARYRTELLDRLGDPDGSRPYFYAYPRILVSGRRP